MSIQSRTKLKISLTPKPSTCLFSLLKTVSWRPILQLYSPKTTHLLWIKSKVSSWSKILLKWPWAKIINFWLLVELALMSLISNPGLLSRYPPSISANNQIFLEIIWTRYIYFGFILWAWWYTLLLCRRRPFCICLVQLDF